jgi:hypothetical protein
MFRQNFLATLWIVLVWSGLTLPVFGQAQPETVTGCLTRADRAGVYTIREEGTGFTITVTGSDDLAQYSAGHKVRVTGKMVREQGEDLFRVTKVEQLSTTCEPTAPFAISGRGMREAVGRATLGVRGGVGFDPAIIYIGGHAQVGPVFRNFWLRPSYEFGFGEVTKINSLNLDGAYFLPLAARGRSPNRDDFWNIYAGAGLGLHLTRRGFEEAEEEIDFGDWDFDTGLNIFMGLSKRSGFFTELRAGAYGSPNIKLIVGYSFR